MLKSVLLLLVPDSNSTQIPFGGCNLSGNENDCLRPLPRIEQCFDAFTKIESIERNVGIPIAMTSGSRSHPGRATRCNNRKRGNLSTGCTIFTSFGTKRRISFGLANILEDNSTLVCTNFTCVRVCCCLSVALLYKNTKKTYVASNRLR